MPFSSLHNPDDLHRARHILDAAWSKIEAGRVFSGDPEKERTQLAYIVAGLIRTHMSSDKLIETAIERFRASRGE